MGKGAKNIPGATKGKSISKAGRKQSGVVSGGRPEVDDEEIMDGVGMLLAENLWLREHDAQIAQLDTTSAIRKVIEDCYTVWAENRVDKEQQVNLGVQRIRAKLSKRWATGKTVLDDAIERAAQQKTIRGTPITQTLLTTPLPPVMAADTSLIYEFLEAVDALAEWGQELSNSRYTILDNKVRGDLKRFMACFKKIKD